MNTLYLGYSPSILYIHKKNRKNQCQEKKDQFHTEAQENFCAWMNAILFSLNAFFSYMLPAFL